MPTKLYGVAAGIAYNRGHPLLPHIAQTDGNFVSVIFNEK